MICGLRPDTARTRDGPLQVPMQSQRCENGGTHPNLLMEEHDMITGVTGFAEVIGQVSSLIAETTGFAAAASTATAAAAAVTPPGNDLDSVRAVTQQGVTTGEFIAMLGAGLEQLGERAAETTAENATFEALGTAGAAAVNAV